LVQKSNLNRASYTILGPVICNMVYTTFKLR
jgi:hypothetical protein